MKVGWEVIIANATCFSEGSGAQVSFTSAGTEGVGSVN